MKPSTKKPSVRTIGNATDSTKTKELRRGGKTPRPADEKIAHLATRLGALAKRVEHDFGGSDSGNLGARVDALEEASEAYGRRIAKVEHEVSLLGIADRLRQQSTRLARLEELLPQDEKGAANGD